MKILSFDIEEWYIEKMYHGGRKAEYESFDYYLSEILSCLEQKGAKATFFCVGGMAREFPEVIKKIAEGGHEIGCHSDAHVWLTKLSQNDLLADTRAAVDSLEQCIGRKVLSYRAPAFSIGAGNKWAFEILAQCGIERDASIFPAERDFGGFANFGQKVPSIVKCGDAVLKEFPICTAKVLGKEIAYSGGGYFRFFPLWFVEKEMNKAEYAMTYFHIGDLTPERGGLMSKEEFEEYFKEPGTLINRYKRYVKSNLGKKSAFSRMVKLINSHDFETLESASKIIDWQNAPVVEL
ncbi:MAG: polysaccharide deacetylase family protein [Bacteroidales bacterium]|nr:polysaccharide deacetylase family protein [Bacteroidales bacterium]